MTDLPALLAEAQHHFSRYRAPYPLAICTCPSCMPPDEQRAFLATPPMQLSVAQLQSYIPSVPLEHQEEKYLNELKRFLPRILHGLCAFEDIAPLTETTLHHLNLDRADIWTAEETAYLQRFARAYIAARSRGDAPLPSAEKSANQHNGDSLANYLLMFHWARLPDLGALTDEWTAHARHLPALRDYLDLLAHTDWTTRRIDWHKALYLPEHCPARENLTAHLQNWLDASATRRAFHASLEHALLNGLAEADERSAWESWYDWLE